jgi:hypothetical protein
MHATTDCSDQPIALSMPGETCHVDPFEPSRGISFRCYSPLYGSLPALSPSPTPTVTFNIYKDIACATAEASPASGTEGDCLAIMDGVHR